MNQTVGHRRAATKSATVRAYPPSAGTAVLTGAYHRSSQQEEDPLMNRIVGHRACRDGEPHLAAPERAGRVPLPRNTPELTQVD